jgi:hypothetical protein
VSATTDHTADRPQAAVAATDTPVRPDDGAERADATGVGSEHATQVAVPAGRHRRRAWLLLAVGAFQVWLWTTRLFNLASDPTPRTAGFVVVHAVLYAAAFGAAGVLLALGWRMRREATAVRHGTASRTTPTGHDAPDVGASP